MKWFKGAAITVMLMPFIVIVGIIIFEIIGMCINHAAADRQTDKLQADLADIISDIEFLEINSETGNASGTGNHAECMSTIVFLTEMTESEIEEAMSAYYDSDNKYCVIGKDEDGSYSVYLETSAPFPDNIEGH